jgi:hypothetical protein
MASAMAVVWYWPCVASQVVVAYVLKHSCRLYVAFVAVLGSALCYSIMSDGCLDANCGAAAASVGMPHVMFATMDVKWHAASSKC